MIEPARLASISLRATACAMKKAARTLSEKIASKSWTLPSISRARRFMPALLTSTSNGTALSIAVRTAARSVTSSVSASAWSPRARIAAATASISSRVRAASVTCAPACASAEAAASPMPRPPPVTSARLPSSRNEGVLARSISLSALTRRSLGCLRVGDVAAAVAAHPHVGLLGVRREAFEDAQPRAIFADPRRGLVGEHLLIGAGLEELADPQAAGIARRLPGRQRVVGADHLVAIGDVGARPQEQRAVVLHVGEEVVV